MSIFRKDPLKERISELEELIASERDVRIQMRYYEEWQRLTEMRCKRPPKVSPDTLVKVGAMIGLAGLGYVAERNGTLLPKWSHGDQGILKI